MSLLSLAWKNIWHKKLSSILSILLLSIGVALISLTIIMSKNLDENLKKNMKGVDMVIGAKGSPLQVILSALYHIDAPTGNISYQEAKEISKHFLVKTAIPLSYGDSYKGVKILGTNELFIEHYDLELDVGNVFEKDFEVCLGNAVAKNLNLKVGDEFYSQHGLDGNGHSHENRAFKVVGIFKASNGIADQLIICDLSDIWDIHEEHHHDHDHEGHDHQEEEHEDHNHEERNHKGHDHAEEDHEEHDYEEHDHEEHDHEEHDHEGHDHEGHDHEGHDHEGHDHHDHEHEDDEHLEEDKEITAMLISYKNKNGFMFLPNMVNQKSTLQAASPSIEINRLFSLLGFGFKTLYSIAIVLMVVSGLSIFISMFQALSARKYELALMRSMGAGKIKLFSLLLLESLILASVGIFIGLLTSRIITAVVSGFTQQSYKYSLNSWTLEKEELLLIGITLIIALLASFLPAFRAGNVDISKVLSGK